MVVIGDKLGLYRAMAGAGPLTPAELAARTGTVERYVREWLSAQAARGYLVLRRRRPVLAARRARHPAHRRDQPGLRDRRVRDRSRLGLRHRHDRRAVPHRRRLPLGRPRRARPRRLRTVLPARLPQPPGQRLDPRARRRRGQARRRRADRRRRLRARRVDAAARRGLPGVDRRRLRRPRRVDRRRPQARRRRRPGRPGPLRGRLGHDLRRPATTWSASSTACTTWATRPAPAPTSATTSPPAGRSC